MGFKLKKNESSSVGIRRLAREGIDEALELLENEQTDPSERVHELRKTFKRIRAVLRLVREELPDEVYRRENLLLRDLGRRLSAARDAAVRVAALDLLRKTYREDFPADEMAPVRNRLVGRQRSAVRRVRNRSSLSRIARDLRDLRRRIRTWPLTLDGFPGIERGLKRTYRQGRRAEDEAYAVRSDEAFHEWRKRAKDLRYHVAILEPVWPEVMENVEESLHELTDRLGDDHDLGDLRRVLETAPAGKSKSVGRVMDLISRRRSELQAEARPLATRIYAEKPGIFTARIEAYWEAWRS
jgi:CHAD domain-containing protein